MTTPTDTAKLREMLARVSQEADDIRYYGGPTSTYAPAADALKQELAHALPAALDEIDTLRARVEFLEGELRRFAEGNLGGAAMTGVWRMNMVCDEKSTAEALAAAAADTAFRLYPTDPEAGTQMIDEAIVGQGVRYDSMRGLARCLYLIEMRKREEPAVPGDVKVLNHVTEGHGIQAPLTPVPDKKYD